MKNVIVISAHPDDEILGCGGTLLKHKDDGDKIDWLITTNIFTDQGFSEERVSSRQDEIEQVKNNLGINQVYKLDFPTMTLTDDSLIKMIPMISEVFNESKPEIIYVLNRSDAHSDHLISFKATMACTKSFRYPFIKKVLMYECISETEFAPALPENIFIPTYFVDISKYQLEKNKIMKIYKSELGEHPFPRSIRNIEALAVYRGAVAGVEYAEAFQVLKWIDK
ncbi:PIG-L family deacetylase [uncultured Aquimarina sp.]|uniref:PIG-L deacetylase family protein n=1 Tax=uncultured Aquimarina sp. TaxID=575652 RepID=UPI0026078703|nr:PIG-L family deacetylase [uncultured Aquimarina sp.]